MCLVSSEIDCLSVTQRIKESKILWGKIPKIILDFEKRAFYLFRMRYTEYTKKRTRKSGKEALWNRGKKRNRIIDQFLRIHREKQADRGKNS